MIREPLEEYHRQRDALIGKSADHLKPPLTYTRGVVLPEDKRSRKTSLSMIVLRGLILFLFFALVCYCGLYIVFFFGLTGKE